MTPMQIHWCVIFLVCGDPVAELGDPHFNSRVGKEVQMWMINEALIEWSAEEKRYLPLPRLQAFVEHLCQQPLPVQKWVMPEGAA